jgi:hypothetical protein
MTLLCKVLTSRKLSAAARTALQVSEQYLYEQERSLYVQAQSLYVLVLTAVHSVVLHHLLEL